MACEMITNINTFSDLLVWPTTCNYYFYLIVILTFAGVLAWNLLKQDEKATGKGDLISSLGVSSIAMIVLAAIGTLVKNSAEIPLIQTDILLIILAIGVPLILVWIFKD